MEPEAKADDIKIVKPKGRPKREPTKDVTTPKQKVIKPKAEQKPKTIKPPKEKKTKEPLTTEPTHLTSKPKRLQNKKLPVDPETERTFKIFLNAETKNRNALLNIR